MPFDIPLHIEGLIAYQRYNPKLVFPDIAADVELDVTWASVAGTIGIGWDFPLTDDWTLRPSGHLSLGRISADAFLVDFPPFPAGQRAVEAVDGNLNSFGAGASISVFREASVGKWEAEYRIRQTFLEFYPLNEPQAGDATAVSNQTTLFSRHRYPLQHLKFLDLPTRIVLDAGLVLYHGDGADVLKTDWVATAGLGLEVDTAGLGVPELTAGRVMLNGIAADEFNGISIGFGVSF